MRKSTAALGVAGLLLLSGCSSGSETAPVACEELDAAVVEEINFVLEAYENGETITSGKIIQVQMEGAGTFPYVALIAAKLTQAGTVALWAQGEGNFIVPLNEPAISATPEAAVESPVISQVLNSPEGQATIKCVK